MEVETDGKLPFPYILTITKGTFIFTDLYCKPSSSDRILSCGLNHPSYQILNIIINLRNRILNITHPDFHIKGFQDIMKRLNHNDYPVKFINSFIKQPKLILKW